MSNSRGLTSPAAQGTIAALRRAEGYLVPNAGRVSGFSERPDRIRYLAGRTRKV